MRTYKNFINNAFVAPYSDDVIAVHNPATEELVGRVSAATAAQALRAVNVAAAAQKMWHKLPAIERAGYLQRFADALLARAGVIAQVLTLESGKSLDDATNEVVHAAAITRYHAEWARRIEGEIIPSDSPSETMLLQREPIGVVACLIPFNYPVYTLLRKIAPALIAGNTVVVRPSSNTPCSAFEIAAAVRDARLPDGVINILAMHHPAAGSMCTDARLGMITLTGSVAAGRKVLQYAQANIAKTSLELGGKTPAIIAADADLEQAAGAIANSKATHCGQLCTAVERVYVQRDVYQQFLALLKQKLTGYQCGDRAQNPDHMGPLINLQARRRVHQMVARAVTDGATLEMGGAIPSGKGFFYPLTLLTDCRQEMDIVQEEIFGPVLCVLPYDSIEQALELANDHQFGLSSVLYTADYRSAMLVANNIEAGELYINRVPADPYQGYHAGWKRSGLGGDDGKHGMLEFTQTRLVVMKY
ncbi:aldehyde dehydrogenase [Paraherbaspirillum soli]|uniref:Aldehyde dehydrogenase n=1 Tax=Paraherbaspirillum soli TaxID=631222 RepID=A0ABW0MCZ5_9BURK